MGRRLAAASPLLAVFACVAVILLFVRETVLDACTDDAAYDQTVSGLRFHSVESDCDTLAKSGWVSVYVLDAKGGREEVLRCDPAYDSFSARITPLPGNAIHVHVPHIAPGYATILKSRAQGRTLLYTFGP